MGTGKPDPGAKNSMHAAGLSFLFPGLGQVYNRQFVKAIFIITSMILAPVAAVFLLTEWMRLEIMVVAETAIWLSSIHDAYVSAEMAGKGESK